MANKAQGRMASIVAAVLLALPGLASPAPVNKKPNVVFILADNVNGNLVLYFWEVGHGQVRSAPSVGPQPGMDQAQRIRN
jgi:hypothetical protein